MAGETGQARTSGGTVYVGVKFIEHDIRAEETKFEREMQKSASRAGDGMAQELAQSFGKKFTPEISKKVRTATQAASKAMTPFKAVADTREMTAKLDQIAKEKRVVELRAQLNEKEMLAKLAALDSRIIEVKGRVDLGIPEAQAELDALQKERLVAELTIQVNEARAEANIAQLTRRESKTIDIDVNASGMRAAVSAIEDIGTGASRATSGISGMVLALASIGPVALPVLAAAAAGVVAVGTAAVSAGAAVGVGALAFSGIGDAVKALGDQSKTTAAKVADSNKSISDGVSRAAAAANAQDNYKRAVQGVAQAQAAYKNAVANANEATAASTRRVEDAERSVADAQRNSRQAQENLNDARKEAAQDLRDLNDQLKEQAFNEEESGLAVERAYKEWQKTIMDPRAGDLDRREAEERYRRAKFNYDQEKKQTEDLKKKKSKADKDGIEGSKKVKDARQRQTDSIRAEKDAERDLADARKGQAETARQNAYSIAQAQQSIRSAQQGVVAAQRAIAVQAASTKASTAATVPEVDKVAQAMKDLSPAAKDFARYLNAKVLPAFNRIKRAAQEALLPEVKSAIQKLIPYEGAVTKVVTNIGNAMGKVITKFTDQLTKDPSFKRFFRYLSESIPRVIGTLGDIGISLSKIFADIFTAAGPAGEELLGSFRDFLNRVQKFLASPQGQKGLKKFFDDAVPVVKSLARLGLAVLKLLGSFLTNPGFQGFVDDMTHLVDVMTKFVQNHPEAVKKGLEGILVALLGFKALGFLGKAVAGIAKITKGANSLRVGSGERAAKGALSETLVAEGGRGAKGGGRIARAGGKLASRAGAIGIGGSLLGGAISNGRGGRRDMVGGAIGGAATGVAIGSFAGPYGAIAGGIVGAIVGALGSERITKALKATTKKITTWASDVRKAFKPASEGGNGFLHSTSTNLTKAGTFFTHLYKDKVKPALDWIADKFKWLYRNVIKPIWNLIYVFIQVEWKLIQVVFGLIKIGVTLLGRVFTWLYEHAVKPAWQHISDWIKTVWGWIKATFGAIRQGIGWVGDKFTWLYRTVKPAFEWLYSKVVKPVWKKIEPVFNAMVSYLKEKLGPAFRAAVSTIKKIWGGLKSVVTDPVTFVVDTLINHGIIDAFNWLAKKVYGNDSHNIGYVKIPWKSSGGGGRSGNNGSGGGRRGGTNTPIGSAMGGVLPGWSPGRDIHKFRSPTGGQLNLSGGEAVMRPEFTRAVGGKQGVDRLNRWAMNGTFAGGGVLGWGSGAWKKARSGAGKIISSVGRASKFLTDPKGAFEDLITKLGSKMPNAGSALGKTLLQVPKHLIDGLVEKVKSFVSPGGGGGYSGPGGAINTGGVGRWAGLVARVLSELGLPANALSAVLTRIRIESGGNPNAINLWDSNARAGHPSQGLMQTIPGTFNAYAGPYRSRGITDPLASIYAGVNYARHRYGSGWVNVMTRPGGYDSGGLLMPGTQMVHNGTNKPERVLTDRQWRMVESTVLGGGGATDRSIHITSDYQHMLADIRHERAKEELRESILPG